MVYKNIEKRCSSILEQYSSADITDADREYYKQKIKHLKEEQAYYKKQIEAEAKKENASQTPSQSTIYCYVFTSTLPKLKARYNESGHQSILTQRYDEETAQWQPFITQEIPKNIAEILADYKEKYPLEIIYWAGLQDQFIALEKHLEDSQALAVIDWIAMIPMNEDGYKKFDRRKAHFVAPVCEQTLPLFKDDIKNAQAHFKTLSAHRAKGLDCSMALFESSNRANFLQDLYRLCNQCSRNIQNKSQDPSSLREINMNL